MTFSNINPASYLFFFLKRESDRFFTSMAIRGFGFGMITIFVPIYIYQYFNSLPLTFLFFAGIYGLQGALVPFGGQIMMKIGLKKAMLVSLPFFWGFYICLLYFNISQFFIFLSIILYVLGIIFFWPAYHTNFARVSEGKKLGKEVGKLNFVVALPGILAPAIGGTIIALFGYPALFVTVLAVLFSSAIPLFLSKDIHQIYTDSYLGAYQRIFKKENRYHNLAFAIFGIEATINNCIWPIFLAILAIGYITIGSVTTVALMVSLFFTLYMGRITDRLNKTKLLTIGSALTSGAWLGKFFVFSPISAFLAQGFYKFARTSAGIPFQTILYQKAEGKGAEIDEFIIYRGMAIAFPRCAFLIVLAGIFFVIPHISINFAFILAAVFSLGFIFMGKIPELKSWFKINNFDL